MKKINRRKFVKDTAVIGAGMAVLPVLVPCETTAYKKNKMSTRANEDSHDIAGTGLCDPSIDTEQIFRIYMGGGSEKV